MPAWMFVECVTVDGCRSKVQPGEQQRRQLPSSSAWKTSSGYWLRRNADVSTYTR